MSCIFLSIRNIDLPHSGRNFSVCSKVCCFQLYNAVGHICSVKSKRQIAVNFISSRVSHRSYTAVERHPCTVEVQRIRSVICLCAGKAKILVLSVLHMFYPLAILVSIHSETTVVGTHFFAHNLSPVCKIIFSLVICCALVHIFLHSLAALAVCSDQSVSNSAFVLNIGAVDSRLIYVYFLYFQNINFIIFTQIIKSKDFLTFCSGLPVLNYCSSVFPEYGRFNIRSLVAAKQQLYSCAVELKGGLCIGPVGEMSVILQRIRP